MPPPRRSLPPNPFHGSSAGRWECRPLQSLPPNHFYGSIRRGGIHPSRVVRPYCCTTQKAGANISFAPAVLLLRSHSLITLFVIFRTVSASSWESSYLYANFDCPFKTLTNCSLDLPSGSLFAQKHLWNGVMFVIKIVLGVMGLMPRTKAS